MNHRTDPRTMEDRWRSMGFVVEWSDNHRAYVVCRNDRGQMSDGWGSRTFRTVDEVEAFVVARAVSP